MRKEDRINRILKNTMLIWGVLGLIIFYPVFMIRYYETDKAYAIVMKYCLPPVLFISILVIPYLYWKYVSEYDKLALRDIRKRKGKKPVNKFVIYFLNLLMYIALMTMTGVTLSGACFSSIIITNAYFGTSETVVINEKIVGYRTHSDRGTIQHFIKFHSPTDKKIIELKVYKYNLNGEYFHKEMKVGCWGILYSKD